MKNLLQDIPNEIPEELFETQAESDQVLIERIVSRGHTSPEKGWYDQQRNEWVLLLKGAARLAFEDGREVRLGPGDSMEIPAHRKHRVAWTDPRTETIWVTVHY